ncbi:MAG TPA: hypothetical protein VIC08_08280 [Cellvibrionaceae bacterium]
MKKYRIALMCLALILAACDKKSADETPSPVEPPAPAPYTPPPAGEIKNPTFTLGAQNVPEHWSLQQHSSSDSYSLAVNDGVLSISRVGDEPWGVVKQTIRTRDMAPFLGKTLEFSADISAEFTDEYGEPYEPPALMVRLRGLRAGTPAMLGRSNILTERTNIETLTGYLPWRRYTVRFDVPEAGEASAVDLELNILMTSGGVMHVRGPSLVVVGE